MGKLGSSGVAGSIAARLVLAGLIAGLAGCAALDRRAPQAVVKERAQARWDALVKSDIPAAYSFFSPVSKSLVTLPDYTNTIKPGFWKSVSVERVDCSTPDSCEATSTIEYEFQGARIKTPLKETWIRDGSNWWYVHK